MEWSRTKFGERLLAEEQPRLDELVRRLHGDVLVWSGPISESARGVKRCMARRCLYLSNGQSKVREELGMATFAGSLEALPLPNNSVDGFVLHHSLEMEDDPRRALREVGRVVAPGGRIGICAFNSFSAWGLRRLYGRFRADVFSDVKFVNPLRLFDWLALLGLELDEPAQYLGFGAPVNLAQNFRSGVGRSAGWLGGARPPLGAVLLASAVKQTQGASFTGHRRPLRSRKLAAASYPRTSAPNLRRSLRRRG
ncbi:MAG: methyltransferase domain-containing protein [Gammaproteobacteria bacterium]|nr:methyltransferase domain-containing protein [Gammaproteobacteria bacterium]MYE52779.1 methyltransferase domain-containing protein [Gammaproteobacteria bacterium]